MATNISLVLVPSTTMSGNGSKFGICWSSEEAAVELVERILGQGAFFMFWETRPLTANTEAEQGWLRRLQSGEKAFTATSFNAMDSAHDAGRAR